MSIITDLLTVGPSRTTFIEISVKVQLFAARKNALQKFHLQNISHVSKPQCVNLLMNCQLTDIFSIMRLIIPPAQQSCWGGILVSLRPSVPHPVSALYLLQFWLDPFHIYASYQATSEGVSRAKFLAKFQNLAIFKICNFDFVLFWLGIWCESLVWVIMGRRGVSQNVGVLVVLVVPNLN